MSGHSSHVAHDGEAHEMTDVNFNATVWIIPISLVILAVFSLICYFCTTSGLTREMTWKQARGADADNQKFMAFENKEDASMHRYQLNKGNKGAVQIPIERAMEMMSKEGSSPQPAKAP